MQRNTVLYLAAVSTLAGAFLLSPRKAPEPPPPAPAPTPEAHDPITHLTYANGDLKVDARLDRGALECISDRVSSAPVWLDMRLTAQNNGARQPLATVLVIDRSGSMAGEKIDQARMAADRLVRRLSAEDQLAVVTYGTDVTVDLPLTVMDEEGRAKALRLIDRIEEGGGTNIDGALAAANRLVKTASKDLVGRVVLISDGRATEGERRPARLAARAQDLYGHGIVTSSIGVGLDYNEDLMEKIAVLGGGRFHHLSRAQELARLLDDEFLHASQVVARGVTVRIPGELSGFRVSDAPGYAMDSDKGHSIRIGDLAAGEERRVLVRLEPPTRFDCTGGVELSAPEVVYVATNTRQPELLNHRTDRFRLVFSADPAVIQSYVRTEVQARASVVESSLALTESMQALAEGDVAGAREKLRAQKQKLEPMAKQGARDVNFAPVQHEVIQLEAVLDELDSGSFDKAPMVKANKARAYQLRH